MTPVAGACESCLRRTWLLARLGGHLEVVRAHVPALLELDDDQLLDAVAGAGRDQLELERAGFSAEEAQARASAAGLHTICRCHPSYPSRLHELPAPPAVLHVAGQLGHLAGFHDAEAQAVALVGSRKASAYGLEVARGLGRGAAAAGVVVVSGLARGIDGAAHAGALSAGETGSAATIAVLPGSAERPYPAGCRRLHAALVSRGAAISELPPGVRVWRWSFLARNRLIAGLSDLTVVVEARERSGSLVTARIARELGRIVGAVPGQITSPGAAGPHSLLREGAVLIDSPQDILDALYGPGARSAREDGRGKLDSTTQHVLDALAAGRRPAVALAEAGLSADRGLSVLAELELSGWIRRTSSGGYTVIP